MPASIHYNFLLEFNKSCTKREAVAKMLGWMQGPLYDNKEFMESEEDFLSENHLNFAQSLDDSLENIMCKLLCSIQRDLEEAKTENASDDVIKRKEAAYDKYMTKIHKVESYLASIEEELGKGESSALKIDQEATRKSGIPHIMLGSLDQWAREKHGIAILASTYSKFTANTLAKSLDKSDQSVSGNVYILLAYLIDAFVFDAKANAIKSGYMHGNK